MGLVSRVRSLFPAYTLAAASMLASTYFFHMANRMLRDPVEQIISRGLVTTRFAHNTFYFSKDGDIFSRTVAGKETRLTKTPEDESVVAVSPRGTCILYRTKHEIGVLSLKDATRAILWSGMDYCHASFSPDGTRVALHTLDETVEQLCLHTLKTHSKTQLASTQKKHLFCGFREQWSPNGRFLALFSGKKLVVHDGRANKSYATKMSAYGRVGAITSVGDLAVAVPQGARRDIYIGQINALEKVLTSRRSGSVLTLSPDGKTLIYSVKEDDTYTLHAFRDGLDKVIQEGTGFLQQHQWYGDVLPITHIASSLEHKVFLFNEKHGLLSDFFPGESIFYRWEPGGNYLWATNTSTNVKSQFDLMLSQTQLYRQRGRDYSLYGLLFLGLASLLVLSRQLPESRSFAAYQNSVPVRPQKDVGKLESLLGVADFLFDHAGTTAFVVGLGAMRYITSQFPEFKSHYLALGSMLAMGAVVGASVYTSLVNFRTFQRPYIGRLASSVAAAITSLFGNKEIFYDDNFRYADESFYLSRAYRLFREGETASGVLHLKDMLDLKRRRRDVHGNVQGGLFSLATSISAKLFARDKPLQPMAYLLSGEHEKAVAELKLRHFKEPQSLDHLVAFITAAACFQPAEANEACDLLIYQLPKLDLPVAGEGTHKVWNLGSIAIKESLDREQLLGEQRKASFLQAYLGNDHPQYHVADHFFVSEEQQGKAYSFMHFEQGELLLEKLERGEYTCLANVVNFLALLHALPNASALTKQNLENKLSMTLMGVIPDALLVSLLDSLKPILADLYRHAYVSNEDAHPCNWLFQGSDIVKLDTQDKERVPYPVDVANLITYGVQVPLSSLLSVSIQYTAATERRLSVTSVLNGMLFRTLCYVGAWSKGRGQNMLDRRVAVVKQALATLEEVREELPFQYTKFREHYDELREQFTSLERYLGGQ